MSKFSYNQALERLNQIAEEMQSEELDIEKIGKLVKESSTLIKACKKALASTEEEINEVISQMNMPTE